uniref:ATP-dependent helicase Rep n=1 Tax=CRESS DNA virus TaxID=3138951 RepID=A0AAU8H4G0_9VIRU
MSVLTDRNMLNISQTFGRNWCGTLNNYTDEQYKEMQEFITEYCKYGIVGKEEAPTTGTKHLQCYFNFINNTRGSFIMQRFRGIHIEVCRGSAEQNVEYCQKNGDFWEYGTLKKKIRTSLKRRKALKDMLKDYMKMPYLEFREQYPYEAFHQKEKLEKWRLDSLNTKAPWNGNLKEKNIWIWGPPGTGKSRWARSQCEQDKIYLKAINKWWSGYLDTTHKVVLFEDFPNDAKYMASLMKVWADRYTFTAEVKGGTIFIDPSNWILIVTSNYCMEECFEYQDYEALKRRFKEVHVTDSNDIFLRTKLSFE